MSTLTSSQDCSDCMCGVYCPHTAHHIDSSAEPYKGGPSPTPVQMTVLPALKAAHGEGPGSVGQRWLNENQMAKKANGTWPVSKIAQIKLFATPLMVLLSAKFAQFCCKFDNFMHLGLVSSSSKLICTEEVSWSNCLEHVLEAMSLTLSYVKCCTRLWRAEGPQQTI